MQLLSYSEGNMANWERMPDEKEEGSGNTDGNQDESKYDPKGMVAVAVTELEAVVTLVQDLSPIPV